MFASPQIDLSSAECLTAALDGGALSFVGAVYELYRKFVQSPVAIDSLSNALSRGVAAQFMDLTAQSLSLVTHVL